MDLRRPEDDAARERVLAEWYGDGPAQEGTSRGPGIAEGVREAARGAEQAMEQQVVPGRFNNLLRRVYRRLERDPSGGDGG